MIVSMSDGPDREDRSQDAPRQEQAATFRELQGYVPAELLDVSFPVAVRGYDRHAVDAYVKRVNRAIAEIKISSSPRAAVKHALEQTEQQVGGLLEQARETADEITRTAREEAEAEADATRGKAADLLVNTTSEAEAIKLEAEKTLADANEEAEAIRAHAAAEAADRRRELELELASVQAGAEATLRDLQADTSAVWEQRRKLLDHIRETAERLTKVADAADEREATEPDLLAALRPAVPDADGQPTEVLDGAPPGA
jgi:DivIVA domain-containing protein